MVIVILFFFITLFASLDNLIKEVKTQKPLSTYENFFSSQDIAYLLEEAYRTGRLTNPDFKSVTCLTLDQKHGGFFSKQIYMIISSCSIPPGKKYILKDAKKYDVERVIEASQIRDISKFSDPYDMPPKFPRIIFPIAYLSYTMISPFEDKHYYYLMPTAKGKNLHDIMQEVKENKLSESVLENAYKQLGIQMANFYQFYMHPIPDKILGYTVTHGDFHGENIFFDEKTDQITLIDTASMKMADETNAIGLDLYYALRRNEISAPIKKFFEGYLLVYKNHDIIFKKRLLNELVDQIKSAHNQVNLREQKEFEPFINSLEQVVQKIINELSESVKPFDTNLLNVFYKDLEILNSYL